VKVGASSFVWEIVTQVGGWGTTGGWGGTGLSIAPLSHRRDSAGKYPTRWAGLALQRKHLPYLMITSKKEQRLYDEIERSLHGIEKREFPARPLEPARCPTCPFFFICPA
jgi:hypothetical protein